VELSKANLREFANGEIHCRYDISLRGSDVFIVQTHCGPVNDTLMEQLIMIDAAKRASAKRITAVCPYYGYSRQDRKAIGREPITAKLVADVLQVAGADRVVSLDLHSGQIQGFFDIPFDHLTAMPVLVEELRRSGQQGHGRRRPRCRSGQGGRALQPAPELRPRLCPQASTERHGTTRSRPSTWWVRWTGGTAF
jgi:ribose-phosphate pyrophosphokinase